MSKNSNATLKEVEKNQKPIFMELILPEGGK
jgi:hypothetical protein